MDHHCKSVLSMHAGYGGLINGTEYFKTINTLTPPCTAKVHQFLASVEFVKLLFQKPFVFRSGAYRKSPNLMWAFTGNEPLMEVHDHVTFVIYMILRFCNV